MSQQEWYRAGEVVTLLKLASPEAVHDLADKGLLPTNGRAKKGRRYAREWVDALALHINRYPSSRNRDTALFELYALHREYCAVPSGVSRNAKEKCHKRVRLVAEQWADTGHICQLEQVAAELNISFVLMQSWAYLGHLSALPIGRKYYVTPRYSKYLIELFTEWLTVDEAAERLHVARSTIYTRVRGGKLAAVKCPDGFYRISPDEINRWKREFPEVPALPVGVAAQRIGCERSTLSQMIAEGSVAMVGQGTNRRVPEYEVERLRRRLNSLNAEFAWLQPIVMQPTKNLHMLSRQQAGKMLGVRAGTVGRWGEEGLLPFVTITLFDGNKMTRLYVKRYIAALRVYIGQRNPKRSIALAYRELCRTKGNIV